ncbi:hypothetical protein MVEN_00727900 [Mycena venus]|uniref:Uncharacterized protein n=1 Tax=Mycena venus TaxID=2733690 RepID=A0A8H6YLA1_9AGAR|nr:hypothetical protein MVEN_00727900 [Mycena venus]
MDKTCNWTLIQTHPQSSFAHNNSMFMEPILPPDLERAIFQALAIRDIGHSSSWHDSARDGTNGGTDFCDAAEVFVDRRRSQRLRFGVLVQELEYSGLSGASPAFREGHYLLLRGPAARLDA